MDIGLQLHASEQRFFDSHGGLSSRDALSAGLATRPGASRHSAHDGVAKGD